jgi:DNA (cytosine-5)-methyltransferase 1
MLRRTRIVGDLVTYYNDNEPFVCDWLRNMIAAGELPPGDVDERSIADVKPEDLSGYDQCHLFCGIGGWPLALMLAGWPAGAPVWTGSCPCQPLSNAGKRGGHEDERHLWPAFFNLIRECNPPVIFGEQVASKDGLEWLDGVFTDLEDAGYACGAADLCAASVGLPHIRQRLFWVADAAGSRQARAEDRGADCSDAGEGARGEQLERSGDSGRVAESDSERHDKQGIHLRPGRPFSSEVVELGAVDGLCNTNSSELSQPQEQPAREERTPVAGTGWNYIHCRDGKLRRVPGPESGLQPLSYGVPRKLGPPLTGMGQVGIRAARANRVGRLRGYGNAIVPTLAAEFIRAYLEDRSHAM